MIWYRYGLFVLFVSLGAMAQQQQVPLNPLKDLASKFPALPKADPTNLDPSKFDPRKIAAKIPAGSLPPINSIPGLPGLIGILGPLLLNGSVSTISPTQRDSLAKNFFCGLKRAGPVIAVSDLSQTSMCADLHCRCAMQSKGWVRVRPTRR